MNNLTSANITATGNQVWSGGASAPTMPPQPETLRSALGRIEKLNEHLAHIGQMATDAAQAVGGPYPTTAADKPQQPSGSIIASLHEQIGLAQRRVEDLENSMSALRGALGL